MALSPTLSARRRRVHPIAVELLAVVGLSVALWGPVVAWVVTA